MKALHKHSGSSKRIRLGILAGAGARKDPSGPFLRFVRDYVDILRNFEILGTGGTAQSIINTGLYEERDVHFLLSGRRGGVVQLAAMVARGECATVVFLSDPRDLWSDVPENRALKRVCIELNVRLITSHAGAEEWARFEARRFARTSNTNRPNWCPDNWHRGKLNVFERSGEHKELSIGERTIALIAHDTRKGAMVAFVDRHIGLLARFDRILATGTTGWLLRLRHAAPGDLKTFEGKAEKRLGHHRFIKLLSDLGEFGRGNPNAEFTKRLMPLTSGPKGGDVLIANEVLSHRCHNMIFFYDPDTAHPHDADIRLLERTAQIPWVYAVCVSDPQSAQSWATGLERGGI